MTGAPPDLERAAEFALLGGALFVAYPKHRLASMIGLLAFAALLEAGQILVPGRDARVHDFVIKAFGGSAGMLAAWIFGYINEKIKMRPDGG